MLPGEGETFEFSGHEAFLIMPRQIRPTGKTPWVWYAPTLPGLPGAAEQWMFDRFLGAGLAIAGIDVGESYGNPAGRALFSAFFAHLVEQRGLAPRACLLARSRGGDAIWNEALSVNLISQLANGVAATDVVVPEPSTYAVLGSMSLVAIMARRRKCLGAGKRKNGVRPDPVFIRH